MANFFIDRPIFAWVLAILLCLPGVVSRKKQLIPELMLAEQE